MIAAARQCVAEVPNGYCPDHSTGVACPVGLGVAATEPVARMEQV
jgi:peptide-methionine (S)-S-oxide reductase